jgi:hypothetical protein
MLPRPQRCQQIVRVASTEPALQKPAPCLPSRPTTSVNNLKSHPYAVQGRERTLDGGGIGRAADDSPLGGSRRVFYGTNTLADLGHHTVR